MTILSKLDRVLQVAQATGGLRALATWSKFSFACFSIVTRLKQAGVAPKTIIDVGANAGQFSVAASEFFPTATIFPIEPDSRVAAALRRNLKPHLAANIVVSAVGDQEGVATFNVNRDAQVSSLLALGRDRIASFPDSKVIESIQVPITTLDILFGTKDLAEPVLVKIDVQGFEDRVIAGASALLKRVEWVLMEVSFSSLYEGERDFEDILALMRSADFRFVRPMNFHTSPITGDIIEMDALFRRISYAA